MRDVLNRDKLQLPFPRSSCFSHLGMDGIKLKGNRTADLENEPDFRLNRFSDQDTVPLASNACAPRACHARPRPGQRAPA
jgi:hypothetical protein